MKNFNKPATSKLVNQFDKQLMELLAEDLKAYKTKNQFVGKPLQVTATLSAA
ncbi:hypothetical protein [Mucilaginibacter lacusdianchii]|uniref:hypothetical protein n=1 Tax=Mucilaginibacter lacusdianchii TaxID=2684211 RepID=UPI00131EBD49|nr:hypothetical protein [Mucilaginibacter sp. JXJ CY 39]